MKPNPSYGAVKLFTSFFNLAYESVRGDVAAEGNSSRIRAVSEDERAISFVSLGLAERKASAGVTVKLLTIDGAEPSSAAVRRGDFPMSRPLTLVTTRLPSGLPKQFIEFALSSQVRDLIVAHDFVAYTD